VTSLYIIKSKSDLYSSHVVNNNNIISRQDLLKKYKSRKDISFQKKIAL